MEEDRINQITKSQKTWTTPDKAENQTGPQKLMELPLPAEEYTETQYQDLQPADATWGKLETLLRFTHATTDPTVNVELNSAAMVTDEFKLSCHSA